MRRAKSLVRRALWWSRWDSNPRPLRCELDTRQKPKLLPFLKLQPPRDLKGFPVLSHSLPSRTRSVQLFLSTYWPLGFLQPKQLRCQIGISNDTYQPTRESKNFPVTGAYSTMGVAAHALVFAISE